MPEIELEDDDIYCDCNAILDPEVDVMYDDGFCNDCI